MPRRIICTLSIALVGATSTSASDVTFNADIRPILQNKCFACHGPDQKARKGDLRLDTRETALEVLAPQNPERSKLLQRITHSDPDERMPPEETHKTITESEVATLTQWIADGAIYEDHWAFIPPNSPPVPEVAGVGHPIDRFISAQLQSHGWKLSPQADRATLIRRVTLDLTGLPPTPEDVERFENSTDPDAFHRVVDRLLASPAYGEHMAATWLETSRYADTDGYQNDRYRYHWAWRDWVIDAFNQNQPYD